MRRIPTVLSRREIVSLLNAVESPRYRAILMLVYGGGLRVGEVVRLRPEDVDEARGVLRVGGASARQVMLSRVALGVLRAYQELHSSPRWLFPGAPPTGHLSTSSVQRAFKRARTSAGLPPDVQLFALRDSFAGHLVERGIGIPHLQALLGHRSPTMTKVYYEAIETDPTTIESPLDTLEEQLTPGT